MASRPSDGAFLFLQGGDKHDLANPTGMNIQGL